MRGGVPGRFDYYSLVLSWSPTFCATAQRPDEQQCNPRDGRRFAFVLHGLWPQYERGFPQDCPSASRPFVPQHTIDRMSGAMPSRGLIIHDEPVEKKQPELNMNMGGGGGNRGKGRH